MNPEILTTVGVGIAILAAVLPAILYLSKRIDEQGRETNKRIDEQGKEQAKFREDMAGRMGKLEGLLEGLREAITGRRAADLAVAFPTIPCQDTPHHSVYLFLTVAVTGSGSWQQFPLTPGLEGILPWWRARRPLSQGNMPRDSWGTDLNLSPLSSNPAIITVLTSI